MKWNIRNRQRNEWKNIIVISSFFRDFFSRISVVPRFYFERSYVSINLKFTVDTRNALIVHFFPLLQYIFIRLFCSRWLYTDREWKCENINVKETTHRSEGAMIRSSPFPKPKLVETRSIQRILGTFLQQELWFFGWLRVEAGKMDLDRCFCWHVFLVAVRMETRFWTINWGWRVEVGWCIDVWMYVYIYASITFLDDRINLSFQKFQITLIFHSKLVRFKIWSNLNDKQL